MPFILGGVADAVAELGQLAIHSLFVRGNRVRNAPQNEGHNTLLKTARLAGGYIASNALDEAAVVAELVHAAMSRPWADDEAEIRRVIADGIANGKTQPLQFTAAPGLMGMFR